jgi:anti-sigma B factor antagonist
MKTNIESKDGATIVRVEGRIDTASSVQAEKDFSVLYETEDNEIVFDCTDLEYISSSGLRLFLALLRWARPQGKHVYFTNMNDYLQEVFTMTGFTSLFEFK